MSDWSASLARLLLARFVSSLCITAPPKSATTDLGGLPPKVTIQFVITIAASILQGIGNTPLIRLNRVVPPGAADVLVKLESVNPAGSYKDRWRSR